mmetsp:Transcript_23025/g.26482  ORF Transcript_23025/g.26482 Transcript_23025/m.26482 type:complete len:421 (+) Transcript_23025:54-1316(+)
MDESDDIAQASSVVVALSPSGAAATAALTESPPVATFPSTATFASVRRRSVKPGGRKRGAKLGAKVDNSKTAHDWHTVCDLFRKRTSNQSQAAFLKSNLSGDLFSGSRSEQQTFGRKLKSFDSGELKPSSKKRIRKGHVDDVENLLIQYFTDFYDGSLQDYSAREKQILQIRDALARMLQRGNFAGVEGLIRGVLYSDKSLCVHMITWNSKCDQNGPTLLHDILEKPKNGCDPPLSLIKMVLDIAPSVLMQTNLNDYYPLQDAVYVFGMDKPTKRSLEIIRFLVESDTKKETITCDVLQFAVCRGDEEVARYLLSYKEGRSALLASDWNSSPLYSASRDYFDQEKDVSEVLLKLFIEATAEELKREEPSGDETIPAPRCCCLYEAIVQCADYLHDKKAMQEKAIEDKLYCTKHASEQQRQ